MMLDDQTSRRTSCRDARKCSARQGLAAIAILLVGVDAALAASPPPLLAEPRLAKQLSQRVTVAWKDQQLAAALAGLAQVHDLPLWIDRRVDPNAAVELSVVGGTLGGVLDVFADSGKKEWGWTTLRTVVYVGPREAAHDLATLSEIARQAIARAPNDVRRKWLTASPWKIPRLSEPRVLLEEVLAEVDVPLRGVDAIPHDLWAERTLPAVAPIDRVVLLLAGFELCVEAAPDGRQLRIVPIRRPVQLVRTYPLSERTEASLEELVATEPDTKVRNQGRSAVVSARWEVHEQLRGRQRSEQDAEAEPDARPTRPRDEQRFTLRIASKPVGAVLAQLAGQLQLGVEWDPALLAATPGIGETLVSCEVREADLDALLTAILEPAGLAFERRGQSLLIRAAN